MATPFILVLNQWSYLFRSIIAIVSKVYNWVEIMMISFSIACRIPFRTVEKESVVMKLPYEY